MLSAMTTSENFPPVNQAKCSSMPTYDSVIQHNYVATLLRKNLKAMSNDANLLKCQLIQGPAISGKKFSPDISYYLPNKEGINLSDLSEGDNGGQEEDDDPSSLGLSKTELETELTEILEQIELDDSIYEQSKPLKIDPNVLKLDFSKIPVAGDLEMLEKLYSNDLSENKRASHHLSGGSLLTDASQGNLNNSENKLSKQRLCKYLGGGVMIPGNVFNFENLSVSSDGIASHLNQISPSTPLTIDLMSQNELMKNVTCGISCNQESTNPFKNLRNEAGEDENSFSKTNPFSDFFSFQSSLNEIPSTMCTVSRYENVFIPQKSFSQCSTRPASPVLKIPDDSSVSNPFLVNEASPESYEPPVPQFFLKESNFQKSVAALQNRSSFIFAVPVFPIFPQSITNSSTQTRDFPEEKQEKPAEPRVYQNVSNQLQKFMKRNVHSEFDLQCLKATVKDLRCSGWYYENVSWQESAILLKDTDPGTFLIRDSSDPNFLFSLSVQTSRGPTSVRLHYVNGQFRLDAEEKLIPHMPSFSSVIELIDYYVENTMKNKPSRRHKSKKTGKQSTTVHKSKDQVWIDSQGNIYSNILLVKPLPKRDHFSTLQHLTRLTINRCLRKRVNAKVKCNFKVTPVYESSPFHDSSFQNRCDGFCPILSTDTFPLPAKLVAYLQDYPYCH